MASSNSVTLFSSVILGIAVYGETLAKGGIAHIRDPPSSACWSRSSASHSWPAPRPRRRRATGTATPPPPRERHAPGSPARPRCPAVHILASVDIVGSWWQYLAPVRGGGGIVGRRALHRRHRAGRGRGGGQPGEARPGVGGRRRRRWAGRSADCIGYAIGNRWGRETAGAARQAPGRAPADGRAGRARPTPAGAAWRSSSHPPSSRARPRCDTGSSSSGTSSRRSASAVSVAASAYGHGQDLHGPRLTARHRDPARWDSSSVVLVHQCTVIRHRPSRAAGAARTVSGVGRGSCPAMMSRWTWEVPPAMPAALLHSHCRAQGPACGGRRVAPGDEQAGVGEAPASWPSRSA